MPADVVTMLESRIEKGQRSEFIVSAIREKFINIYLDELNIPKPSLKFGEKHRVKDQGKSDPLDTWFNLPAVIDIPVDEHVKLLKKWRDEE